MLTIAKDTVAAITYALTVDGEPVDKSEEGAPLVYLHGHGNIIPGLEAALIGKQQGDKLTATIAAKDAYGERDEGLDFLVGEEAFPEAVREQLQPGFRFRAEHPGKPGVDVIYTILGRQGTDVAVTGNHELAGKTLNFAVEVAWVRPATDEEKAHGHIHSNCCGGHSHGCADKGEHGHEHGGGCSHDHDEGHDHAESHDHAEGHAHGNGCGHKH
jgi:FKBP-type peptidyl-prolyl cis-trans isomerase SlyD